MFVRTYSPGFALRLRLIFVRTRSMMTSVRSLTSLFVSCASKLNSDDNSLTMKVNDRHYCDVYARRAHCVIREAFVF